MKPSAGRIRPLLLAALCAVAGACAWENPNEDLEHLNGLFIADDGIYVAADRFW